MKGENSRGYESGIGSFASKYQPPSVKEECPAAKEGFGKIHYDETTGALHSLSSTTVARDAKVTEEVSTLHSADAKLRDQAARNRTSIEELEMKLKEELLRLERDHEGKLDESRQQLYKVHNELSDTFDARLVEHVEQLTRIVDDKHKTAFDELSDTRRNASRIRKRNSRTIVRRQNWRGSRSP